jgi:hypothetical protein
LSSIFQSFTDAFGGVVGQLAHTHKYATAGTYSILLMVTDDDDGVTSQTKDVPILTPGKAVEQIITLLNQLIANTTNSAQLKALNDARKALQGSVIDLSANGGTRKLTLTEVQAALTKLRQALVSLQAAQTKGADTGTLVALVQQVMASLQTP